MVDATTFPVGGGEVLNLSRALQQDPRQTATATTQNSAQTSASGLSAASLASSKTPASNVLSGNFVHTGHNESQYIAATKNALAIDRQMDASSMLDVLASILPESVTDAAFWYGDDQMAQAKALKDSTQSNAQNLQDMREDIDRKAAEAQSQTAEGESGREASRDGDAGQAAAQNDDAGQAADASRAGGGDAGAAPVSGEQTVAAQASATAAVSAAVPEGATATVPAPQDTADAAGAQTLPTSSIDIFV
ncbi:MAG: hypothetical protein ACP59X_17070 [Solidesulfovibrio sp. DCME]|uniref:hypothetical protein n=1 Tax=Solidesulfovibrio sp. DCME TaxID=3447380 RepID=UPI003D0AD543